MRRVVSAVVLASVLVAAPALGRAQEALSDAKRADIERLLQMTGALKIGQMFGASMSRHFEQALRQARPDIPGELFTIIGEEVDKTIAESMTSAGGFVDLVTPLYHRYFTHDEVKGMLTFYGTPLGQKAISVMPQMTQESMAIGQQWAQRMAPMMEQRIRARFKQRGVEL
jgi:hypothetical protein